MDYKGDSSGGVETIMMGVETVLMVVCAESEAWRVVLFSWSGQYLKPRSQDGSAVFLRTVC